MIPWQTQAQQQCTALQHVCTVIITIIVLLSCLKDWQCLLSNQTYGRSNAGSITVFSGYTATLEVQHLRSSVLNIQHHWFVHKIMLAPRPPLLHTDLLACIIAPLRVMLTRLAK